MGKMAKNGRFLAVLAIAMLGLWGLSQLAKPAYDPADHAGFSEQALAARVTQIVDARLLVDALDGNHPIFYATLADRASETGLHDLAYELAEMAVGDLVNQSYNEEEWRTYSQLDIVFYTCLRIARVTARAPTANEPLDRCIDQIDPYTPFHIVELEHDFGFGWQAIHEQFYIQVDQLGLREASRRLAETIDREILPNLPPRELRLMVGAFIPIVDAELGEGAASEHCVSAWASLRDHLGAEETSYLMVFERIDCFVHLPAEVAESLNMQMANIRSTADESDFNRDQLRHLLHMASAQFEFGRSSPIVDGVFAGDGCEEPSPQECLLEYLMGSVAFRESQSSTDDEEHEWISALLFLAVQIDSSNVDEMTSHYEEFFLRSGTDTEHVDAIIAEFMSYSAHERSVEILREYAPIGEYAPWRFWSAGRRIVRRYIGMGETESAEEVLSYFDFGWPEPQEELEDDEGTFTIPEPTINDEAVQLALLYGEMGQFERAIETMDHTEFNFNSVRGPIVAGQVMMKLERPDIAREWFELAVSNIGSGWSNWNLWDLDDPTMNYEALIAVSLVAPVDGFESELPQFPIPGYGRRWNLDALIPY